MPTGKFQRGICVTAMLALSACGGGNNAGTTQSGGTVQRLLSSLGLSSPESGADSTTAVSTTTTTAVPSSGRLRLGASAEAVATLTPAAASRFLTQATFGPTDASISDVATSGRDAWITAQFALPQQGHLTYMQELVNAQGASAMTTDNLNANIWKQMVKGDDQLRQRVAFALSQIFVVSQQESNLWMRPAGVASYYDMLERYSFGNYRDLLQAVALHPMMGLYLSHLHNQKESGTRMPDENFAREIMQLMSIGLYQLNADGTPVLVNGKQVETYRHDDVAGLAKVFTGWSWAGPDQSASRFMGVTADPAREYTPMQMYAAYHSTSEKTFLGVTATAGATGEQDLKLALDTLFNHPNVGPFIGRQLIERLVTSNPSPAYVGRVAAAFADNGNGVRGDMKALIRAVLLDPEAMPPGTTAKMREPVIRLTNWMRAFNAKAASGLYLIGPLDDPAYGLGQSPLRSPSVFNFYRPAYTPANTTLSAAGMVAPEMQITAEPSVIGYLNYMQNAIPWGTGVGSAIKADYSAEIALAATPDQLVDRVNLLLLNGNMSTILRSQILTAVNNVPQAIPNGTNAAKVLEQKTYRVYAAIFLTMASPEYIVQQ
jgi:uncharacterized protein (DUF1800 family)